MKIIEGMKQIKLNLDKIETYRSRIGKLSATTNMETPEYGVDQKKTIDSMLQAVYDLGQDNIALHTAIQRINLTTYVPIEIGGKTITRTIAEWVLRRRTYAHLDLSAWSMLTDRSIKEGYIAVPGQTEKVEVKIVRHFDPKERDARLALYQSEPYLIDSKLEVVNAVTDLILEA